VTLEYGDAMSEGLAVLLTEFDGQTEMISGLETIHRHSGHSVIRLSVLQEKVNRLAQIPWQIAMGISPHSA